MAAASFSSLFFMLLFHLPIYSAEEVSSYDEACPPSSCGDVEINQGCGFYAIECTEPESIPKIQFEKEGRQYVVKNISYTNNELTIQDDQFSLPLLPTNCGFLNNSIVPDLSLFNFTLTSPELTFFKCMKNFNPPESFRTFQNYTLCREENIYYTDVEDTPPLQNPPPGCSIVQYPVPRGSLPRHGQDWSNDDFLALFSAGFSLNWENFPDCFQCQQRGGRCDLNQATQSFRCNDSRKPNVKRKVIVGVCAGIGSFLTACLLAFLFYRPRHNRLTTLRSLSADSSLGPDLEIDVKPREHLQTLPNVEAFLNEYGSFAPKRYKYSAVKKMTKSFRHKLGQGGYGDVFKGKLPDSRSVAVKILTKSKGNGEDFINEVASIGRTSHVNIVTLLGFCSEGPKRALIYEFMPNGSLEKFIYSDRPRTTHPLGWEKLYQIAIGIARGLEYLHCWCNTRILHFDIKPHNILLDKDFCPKISDFGLAKLCPSRESSVSMLDARGTVGYTAPELFCRNIGRVSNKSDVYSYGMMVLEEEKILTQE